MFICREVVERKSKKKRECEREEKVIYKPDSDSSGIYMIQENEEKRNKNNH